MAKQKQKVPKQKTPVGVAVWPRLNKPDTQFDDDGVYSVRLRLDPKNEEHAEFLAGLDKAYDDAVAEMVEEHGLKKGKFKLSSKPYKNETDRDSGDETGFVVVNFKMKATGTNKSTDETWERRPALFDSAGKPCPGAKVGGGSEVRVSFQAFPFYTALAGAGLTLRLLAVQIKKLVEWSAGGTADSYGFESDGDGFVASEAEATAPADDDADEPEEKPAASKGKGKKSAKDDDDDF